MRLALAVLTGCAAPQPHAAPPPPALDPQLLSRLAGLACPSRVTGVEAVWGPLHYQPNPDAMANLKPLGLPVAGKRGVESASVQLLFDIYHFDPRDDPDPTVGALALHVSEPAATAVEAFVRDSVASLHDTIDGDDVTQTKTLFFRRHARELVIEPCGTPPRWAQLAWTPGDVAAMSRAVVAVLDGESFDMLGKPWLTSADAHATLETRRLAARRWEDHVAIQFKRPLPARALLEQIGATRVVLAAVDFHHAVLELRNVDRSDIEYRGWRLALQVDDADKLGEGTVLDLDRLQITGFTAQR